MPEDIIKKWLDGKAASLDYAKQRTDYIPSLARDFSTTVKMISEAYRILKAAPCGEYYCGEGLDYLKVKCDKCEWLEKWEKELANDKT